MGIVPQAHLDPLGRPFQEPVLADYRSNIPQARDAEVLDLLAVLATRISASISQEAG